MKFSLMKICAVAALVAWIAFAAVAAFQLHALDSRVAQLEDQQQSLIARNATLAAQAAIQQQVNLAKPFLRLVSDEQ